MYTMRAAENEMMKQPAQPQQKGIKKQCENGNNDGHDERTTRTKPSSILFSSRNIAPPDKFAFYCGCVLVLRGSTTQRFLLGSRIDSFHR
jgi:hypothetical protein